MDNQNMQDEKSIQKVPSFVLCFSIQIVVVFDLHVYDTSDQGPCQ
jgi:hypothetical protein